MKPGEMTVSPLISLSTPGEYAQQGRFAGAVQADHANLRAVKIGKVDVFEDRLLVVKLADADHGIDDFVWFSAHVTNFGIWNADFGF